MAKYKPREILLGYHKPEVGSGIKFISASITGNFTLGMRGITGGRLAKLSDRVSRRIAYSSTRSYGMLLVSFGFLSMLIHFIKGYLGYYEELPMGILITCAVLSAVAVPLLVFDKPLCLALQDFPPTDHLFFEFFCIKRMHYTTEEKGIHPVIALFVGIALAALGTFVPVVWVMLGFLALVYLYLTFISPEFSFLLIFLAIPYLPLLPYAGHLLASAVGVTLVSFARKVFQGKRVYYFEQYDLLIYLFLAAVMVGGVFFNSSSALGSLIMTLLTGGYVLSGCLITNRRLADCAVNAVVISSIPVSIMAVIYFILNLARHGTAGLVPVSATFENSSTLAVFLLISAAFAFYFIIEARSGGVRTAYIFILGLLSLALVTTLELWALVAAAVGIIAYGFTKVRRTSGALLGITALLPYGVVLLPAGALDAIDSLPLLSSLELPSVAERFMTSLRIFISNILFGVGVGEGGFASAYEALTDRSLPDSGNLLLEIGCEMGVIALVLFLLIFLVRMAHRIIYVPYVRNSQVGRLCRFTSATTVMLFVFGAVFYIWSDMTVYYMFWCVFGIGSATLRVSKREFDDRVGYFRDGSGSDSSNIDIVIR